MKTLILNDQHFGIKKRGGSTPESSKALEDWMFEQFKQHLAIPHDELILLGDLCDSRTVPEHVMSRIIQLLVGENCTIVLGNHCLGGVNDTTISSTEFMAHLLRATLIKKPTQIRDMYIIPHLFNQEAHEEAVAACPEECFMLTHCNIVNTFAVGDHSLNLSDKEITVLGKKSVQVISGHEHARRTYRNVEIIGNQMPSSIADCLNKDSYACVIEDGNIEFIPTWQPEGDYLECDYTEIAPSDYRFIRVNGTCQVSEFPSVVREISQLRKTSDAFIISNNVQVQLSESETVSLEEVTNFNILDLLLERIEEEFREDIKTCI